MRKLLWVFLIVVSGTPVGAAAQQTSVPNGLQSQPYAIHNTWYIGGHGPWNQITMDAKAGRLYIAHGTAVQVVDVASGTVAGTLGGFAGARDIALDADGAYGYVSDGPRARVTVFDRGTLQRAGDIATEPSPASLVLEPQTGLLFVVCSAPAPASLARRPGAPVTNAASRAASSITVIDPETRMALGAILFSGTLGAAQADGLGSIYVARPSGNEILRFNALAAENELQQQEAPKPAEPKNPHSGSAAGAALPLVDWTAGTQSGAGQAGQWHVFRLGAQCPDPAGIAIDGADQRIFAACANMAMMVVNAATGEVVTTQPIGPGAQAVGWDADRGNIFVANGGGDGSITVIHRDVTDTYTFVQTLPTLKRARVMALDPSTNTVYLVTDYMGVARGAPSGFGPLKGVPVEGSFQVLAISQ